MTPPPAHIGVCVCVFEGNNGVGGPNVDTHQFGSQSATLIAAHWTATSCKFLCIQMSDVQPMITPQTHRPEKAREAQKF